MLDCRKHFGADAMNDDLIELNKQLAKRIGLSPDLISAYAGSISICLGKLKLNASEILTLANSNVGVVNSLESTYINRDYLNFARLVAQGIVSAGQFAGLLILGINLDQARVLARLNNVQITQVAKFAAGEVYEFIRPVQKMQNFQSSSRQQFAVALLAA